MVQSAYRRWLVAAIAAALAIVTMLVYLPVRHHELLNWDDLTYLPNNDHVKGGLTWNGIVWSFTHSYSANWCPLTWISYMIGCQFYGLSSAGHHLTNAALHAINTALLFLLLRRLTSGTWRSAFVAALFGLHPLHVESVAWIAERKDVLSTFFFFLTLLAYARHAESVRWQVAGGKSEIQNPETAKLTSQVRHKIDAPMETAALRHVVTKYAKGAEKENRGGAKSAEPESRIGFKFQTSNFKFLALILFALGLMSKPMLVTVPFVLLLLDYWPLRRMERGVATGEGQDGYELRTKNQKLKTLFPLLWEKLPFFALSAACCIITMISQKEAGAVASFEAIPLGTRLANAAVAYVQYLAKFFWPSNLSPLYPHVHWAAWQVIGSVALLVIISAVAWVGRGRGRSENGARTALSARTPLADTAVRAPFLGRRGFPYLLTGWLWFLGTLVPVIGIVQVGSQAFADRYTYIPLIGIMVAVTWLLTDVVVWTARRFEHPPSNIQHPEKLQNLKSKTETPSGIGAWTLKFLRSPYAPGAPRKGRAADFGSPSPGAADEVSVKMKPSPGRGEGKRFQPVHFQRSLVLGAWCLAVLVLLAWRTNEQLRYWQNTETLFTRVLERAPNSVQALYALGSNLIDAGKVEEGKKLVERAIALQPAYAEALGTLANTFDGENKYAEAIRFYDAALKAASDNAGVLNNLAWLRASCPDPAFRDGAEAVRMATRACELTGYTKPLFIGTLAAAQAEARDFQSAITTAERAASLATSLRLDDTAARNRELIGLYRQGKAAHGGPPK